MFSTSYFVYMVPAILLTVIAQFYVKSAYRRWSKVPNQRGITGLDAVQRLIRTARLHDIEVQQVPGNLTDHYDPRKNVLRLSPGVAQNPSVASLAIAAHELGHAMQDRDEYLPLRFRAALVPVVNIGSNLSWILIFAGILLQMTNLSWIGVILFSSVVVFSLATLPVELNASSRARQLLSDSGLLVDEKERKGVSTVLNAAALTYVAALFTAIMQLLYYASLITGRRRR